MGKCEKKYWHYSIPFMMNAAAPDGTLSRRIGDWILKNLPARRAAESWGGNVHRIIVMEKRNEMVCKQAVFWYDEGLSYLF